MIASISSKRVVSEISGGQTNSSILVVIGWGFYKSVKAKAHTYPLLPGGALPRSGVPRYHSFDREITLLPLKTICYDYTIVRTINL